jgi:WD40 repeat protein
VTDKIALRTFPEGATRGTVSNGAPAAQLALGAEGRLLAAPGLGINLWSLPSRDLIGTLRRPDVYPTRAALTPDGRTLVAAASHTLQFWSIPEQALIAAISSPDYYAGLALSPDGRKLAVVELVAETDSRIQLYSLPDRHHLATLRYPALVTALTFTADGRELVAASARQATDTASVLSVWALEPPRFRTFLAEPE